ncbi:aldose 1-epimerase family protein [Flavobacterium sp. K5-23]|uniref:aldose 1-epimerase family protein n=1 Tax=Flavobacterium sp. K5-23 TaxID=2746225 RepID=UPI00200F36FC|nr:aldose 1-epimerase family protein [Flavobacterium sp. K5-23]UQD56848.1 aldose 1-epimerase family protein [Flavobacterium sp. K5-23]
MNTTLTQGKFSAVINHKGAELISFKKNSKEYIWNGNPEFWAKHSPVLFPIVGTLKDNTYSYNETEYHLSRHGFARDMLFERVDHKENSATFSLKSNEITLKQYPFEFELLIIYTLQQSSLCIQYKVINNTNSKMPFSIGAHPAFSLAGTFDDYSLQFEKEETLEYHLLENGLITNQIKKINLKDRMIPLKYQLFKDDALVFKKLESKTVTILENNSPILRVNFEDFPNLGIWTLENAPFLCIEPWFGYSNTIESSGDLFEKEGIQLLDSSESFEAKFSINIL